MNHQLARLSRFFFVAALVLLVACRQKNTASAETQLPGSLYVFAEPSLPLRDQPAETGKVLTAVPFGSAVTVTETSGKTETLSGKSGKWIKTTYQNTPGWLFSGFLSPIPLPAANCTGLLDYARSAFQPESKEVRTYDDPAQAKSGTGGSYSWQQKFSGNVYAEGNVTDIFSSMTLFVPVKDDEIGFHICKRCTPLFRSLSYGGFKAQSSTIKECGGRTSQGGCTKIWFIEVNPTENGLALKCGADSI